MKKFRENGAIGALLDEYEKALVELENVITTVTVEELITIVDSETDDMDCKSIQTILTHVTGAGYTYVVEIRKSLGEEIEYIKPLTLETVQQYQVELKNMFAYNERLFRDYPHLNLEEHDPDKKIIGRWGQRYDIEQLFEHAIVHVLRHRRQIERFCLVLRKF